jgi:hypothetical protein
MVDHLVFFKFKPEVSASRRAEIGQALKALQGVVPGVVEITCGENFTARGQGHQFGLFVRLKDKAALETYARHPAHVEVVESMIKPFVENIIAIDYEF